jgi:hypothetical protein
VTTLRGWLRKTPQPARLRITTDDGEKRDVELAEDLRGRWKSAEDTIIAAGAVAVEALDASGRILRAQQLVQESDGDGGPLDPEEREERYASKLVARERRELAGVLESQGRAIVKAYEAGADAAGQSQEKLVQLVEVLTVHLANAISNLHRISVQFAEAVQGEEPKSNATDDLLKTVVGAAVTKAMTGGGPAAAPANGKGK